MYPSDNWTAKRLMDLASIDRDPGYEFLTMKNRARYTSLGSMGFNRTLAMKWCLGEYTGPGAENYWRMR